MVLSTSTLSVTEVYIKQGLQHGLSVHKLGEAGECLSTDQNKEGDVILTGVGEGLRLLFISLT